MIQRIQSLYLTVVFFLSLLLFRGSLLSFRDTSGGILKLMISGNLNDQNGQIISKTAGILPFIAILILICLISALTIFLYRRRKYQLLLARILMLLSAGLIAFLAWFALSLADGGKMTLIPGFNIVIPVLILLFSFLAHRGILKDDRLVRSYDRLR